MQDSRVPLRLQPDATNTFAERGMTMTQLSRMKVLIAHGDPLIAAGLAVTLQKQRDFEAVVCRPALQAPGATAGDLPPADVVIADYDSGLRLILSAGGASRRVVILTHDDGEAKICHALERGARGYLLLGCSIRDLLDGLRSVRVGGMAMGPLVAGRVAEWMKYPALTPREADILRQMMLGLSNKRIAIELSVAVGTVKTHVKSILDKLEATSRTEAVAIAQRRGILQEQSEGLAPDSSVARIGARSGVKESGRDSKWSRLRHRSGTSDVTISLAAANLL
jgi:DNA-binding NarL/FixJ family response regulator